MHRIKLLVVSSVVAAAGLMGAATPASATTCAMADPLAEKVVCGAYFTVVRVTCPVFEKVGGNCIR